MPATVKASNKFITIVGETTSGKSALAMYLAETLDGEIICADSTTLRRGLNIGTAKPSLQDQALIPHHLIDIIEPDEKFTVANFKLLAEKAIFDIQLRNKLPILVGGTGLYIDAVLYNYSFSIKDDRDRQEIRDDCFVLGLKTDRQQLKSNIKERVEAMVRQGLEAEVRGIANSYGWDCIGLKNVGYRQWKEYVNGSNTLDETLESIVSATLSLAKKQRTWFKRNNSIQWYYAPVNLDELVDILTTYLST